MDYAELVERADTLPEGHPELAQLQRQITLSRIALRGEIVGDHFDRGGVRARVRVLQQERRWKDLVALTERAIKIEERDRMQRGQTSPTALCHILAKAHNEALGRL